MISHLSGTILSIKDSFIILDVHGIGYKVTCAKQTIENFKISEEISLHTYLSVKEDSLELFGFTQYEELELFTLLVGVNGIGPRSAIGILGLESTDKLINAIVNKDVGYLTKVSGIGKKSAEKIILELKDKVSISDISNMKESMREEEDVLEALKTLGYRADEARNALRQVPSEITNQSTIIKEALKFLSQR
jgi:Holliday junction DNA helicase RuvA